MNKAGRFHNNTINWAGLIFWANFYIATVSITFSWRD